MFSKALWVLRVFGDFGVFLCCFGVFCVVLGLYVTLLGISGYFCDVLGFPGNFGGLSVGVLKFVFFVD